MFKGIFLSGLLLLSHAALYAQPGFPELVEKAFGIDQELVNGIQFSNHYGRIGGQPYFFDGRFRAGKVCINNRWHNPVKIRYNLYSQKVEMEYQTSEGNLNQIMCVPEHLTSFFLEGFEFVYMQFPQKSPAYYQVIRLDKGSAYVAWTRTLVPSKVSNSKPSEFSDPMLHFHLTLEDKEVSFFDRNSYLKAFQGQSRKEFARLLRQHGFSFHKTSAPEVDYLIRDIFQLYEKGIKP